MSQGVLCGSLCVQEKSADYDSYCMLAEAYMTLQEPDKAASAYEVSRLGGIAEGAPSHLFEGLYRARWPTCHSNLVHSSYMLLRNLRALSNSAAAHYPLLSSATAATCP